MRRALAPGPPARAPRQHAADPPALAHPLPDNIAAPDANFETILSLLSSFFVPADDDAFMRWIQATLALKGLRAKMAGWRREWQELLSRGEAIQALL